FPSDRELGNQMLALVPMYAELAIENRQFLARAATWVANQGVGQFIDVGCGLPTEPSTHDSVRTVIGDAQVAYVDNDPVVITHLRAMVEKGNPGISVLDADAGDATDVMGSVGTHLDWSAPACLILGALLHFYSTDAARDLVARYADALAPGSYVVLSTLHADSEAADESLDAYSSGITQVHQHNESDVAGFLGALEVMPPGVVEARQWRPGWELPSLPPRASKMIVGVARKPHSAGLPGLLGALAEKAWNRTPVTLSDRPSAGRRQHGKNVIVPSETRRVGKNVPKPGRGPVDRCHCCASAANRRTSMGRPIIGITSELDAARWGDWIREAAVSPVSYIRAVERAGGAPVIVPPVPPTSVAAYIGACDGLVFTGGRDIDPSLYDQERLEACDEPNRRRDQFELALMRAALEAGLPFLAIGRGLHVLALARGGTLTQDLPGHRVAPTRYAPHDVVLGADSVLGKLLGTRVQVPAAHHQAPYHLGNGLTVVGWSTDGEVTEALEVDGHRFGIGIHWHPEEGDDTRLLAAFVEAAAVGQAARPTPKPVPGTEAQPPRKPVATKPKAGARR
ncbi:MAG: SAM-dependent methyltransferase, partial [Trebonia sp.]